MSTLRASLLSTGRKKAPDPPRILLRRGGLAIGPAAGELGAGENRPDAGTPIGSVTQLALDAQSYILRTLSPLRLPASRARSMAALDVRSSTPFSIDDVHCFSVQALGDAKATAYAIVKRSLIDTAIETMRLSHRPISRVVLLPRDENDAPIGELSPADLARLNGTRNGKRIAEFALAAAFAAAIGTIGHWYWQYHSAQTALEITLPPLEAEAKKARAALNERAARLAEVDRLRGAIASQRRMTDVLEEISRLLPDSVYLTDLTVEGESATLVGFAGSASSIISPIEASPMFERAEFASPVLKVPGQDGERFDVKLKVLKR